MVDFIKAKMILAGIILGGILTLSSCGLQEREDVPNPSKSGEESKYTEEPQAGDGETATKSLSGMTEAMPETVEATPETVEAMSETVEAMSETASENPTEEDNIDASDLHDGAEAYLADLDIPPLYAAFLRNEISVPNPFVPDSELSFFDDRDYAQVEHVFEDAAKSFALVDVNNDGVPELIFRIYSSPDELMYILGIQGDQLICYDVQETHTFRISFWINDIGIVTWGQNYDGAEMICYTYDNDGSPLELIHFVWEEPDADSGVYERYYYMDGDEAAKCILQNDEEYEALVSSYEGGEPEWFFCDSFADIPRE